MGQVGFVAVQGNCQLKLLNFETESLMFTERSITSRVRHLKAVKIGLADDNSSTDTTIGEIVVVGLGDRMVISEQAEVWTIRGVLNDGRVLNDPVGEISFVMIPGQFQPATAVVGYIAPHAPNRLGISEEALWPQLRAMISQLGYDLDGFYVSLSVNGKPFYRRELIESTKGR
jgi:hypothetical protein